MTALGWGARPLPLPPGLEAEVVPPPAPPPVADVDAALAAALRHPVGSRPLREVVTARTRAVVILPDARRAAPRAALYAALRRELAALPDDRITLAIANGGHAPGPLEELGLPPEALARHRVVNHDARDVAALVEMGRTSRGTRLRLARCLAEADVVVTTGRVKPHPFVGYGGGATGIFPGLGQRDDIRQSRALGDDPASRLGRADQNPCRDDLEEAARRLGRDTFLLDVIEAGGAFAGAVAGDLVLAHREGVRRLRPYVEVRAAPAGVVIASARLPVAASLAQAARLVAPAGLLLAEGGVAILAVECPGGVGPVRGAGEPVFDRRLRRYLPPGGSLLVVSSLDEATVRAAGAEPAPSLEAALAEARRRTGGAARVVVLPDAGDLVPVRAG